jgi:hypothetical protein
MFPLTMERGHAIISPVFSKGLSFLVFSSAGGSLPGVNFGTKANEEGKEGRSKLIFPWGHG